jgi:hypothetical protein
VQFEDTVADVRFGVVEVVPGEVGFHASTSATGATRLREIDIAKIWIHAPLQVWLLHTRCSVGHGSEQQRKPRE